ncbi:DNA ligase 3 isoform X1 [Daktulosphaira vitifoliae]|uniref:DNA ligase 3 isoform X1 n=1 Tax=Daktulosphaira vitifoliae TaxID=58002 RepID=UPI0021A98D39|nr:DNA ligase 3 isoform X1 [Daktulosphaira vitifoliae]XP_050527085.1 DNA ligase 3 isoform X1 [Daktulosphaira vitifoliae]
MEKESSASMEEKNFIAEKSKSNRAKCKKCKEILNQGSLRIAKIMPNPFGDGKMMAWHHPQCLVSVFAKQRASTAKITCVDDIGGWNSLSMEHQNEIFTVFPNIPKEKIKTVDDPLPQDTPGKKKAKTKITTLSSPTVAPKQIFYFKDFRKLCMKLSQENSYTQKTAIVKEFFDSFLAKENSVKSRVESLYLWCKLLLPNSEKRIYNLQSKQLIKLFSQMFSHNTTLMLEDLEKGDVAETIRIFFEKSNNADVRPALKATLTLVDVDSFLDKLSAETTENGQKELFKSITTKCTGNDLKMIIRLIVHDLRINCGPKFILGAIHPNAYESYQTTHNLEKVVKNICLYKNANVSASEVVVKSVGLVNLSLLIPILPMLAEPCKCLSDVFKKCPSGIYSEIKYDGERVQLHKSEKEYKFFSRSLKPVLDHKVRMFKEYIPKAFQHGRDMILDCEVLMFDVNTNKPLPFGTLGIHKKSQFKDANPCLFVFDCMYYNGTSLLDKSIVERRKVLEQNMIEIKGHIMFSEVKELHRVKELEAMVENVLKQGFEGLVLKDLTGVYEPGKRHWQKVKKDYLFGGTMADSADLVVLGAWFGTGNKGGMMSIFLMGCYDAKKDVWCTVTKVHGGHDDKTLEKLQSELKMVKISKDATKIPAWLKCTKTMIPDFIAEDPKEMPVWEISGAEFSQADIHTANGISIRFPRVTKIRDDKHWESATSLSELQNLFNLSKKTENLNIFSKNCSGDSHSSPSKDSDSDNSSLTPSPKIRKKTKRTLDSYIQGTSSSKNTDEPNKKKIKLTENGPKKPLPDLFTGIHLVVPNSPIKNKFLRYFIAYGGTVLDSNDATEATHIIIDNESWSKNMHNIHQNKIAVTAQWFWDSIRNGTLLSTEKYLLKNLT